MFISRLQVADSKTNLHEIRLVFLCCRRRLGETRLPEALSAILKPTFVSVQHVCMRLMLVRDGRFVVFVLPLTHIVKVAYRAIFATADMCAQHRTPAVASLIETLSWFITPLSTAPAKSLKVSIRCRHPRVDAVDV
jgi:hypothetical protein